MAKKVLCVDLGDVLVKFEEKPLRNLIKEDEFPNFLSLILDHDRGALELFDLHKELNFRGYFKKPVSWKDFVRAYADCIHDVHTPMFTALMKLKESGARLLCLTDNNHFCFYMTSFKFPQVCDLFHEDGNENWTLSYKYASLKRDVGLFVHVPSQLGCSFRDMAFVDNMPINIEKAVEAGFKKSSCFLYNRFDPENHVQFLKFLDKHFPQEAS